MILLAVQAILSGNGHWGVGTMSGLALAMFVGLFGWGQQIVGYQDPHGKVQLALFAAFCFGLLVGYRANRG